MVVVSAVERFGIDVGPTCDRGDVAPRRRLFLVVADQGAVIIVEFVGRRQRPDGFSLVADQRAGLGGEVGDTDAVRRVGERVERRRGHDAHRFQLGRGRPPPWALGSPF